MANWIASKKNPLTARVAINHMRMRHFGKPLAATVFNFGLSGKPPSHPELMDWLAVEFMESGWDMKAMHRLMVTSRTYRAQSFGWTPNAPEAQKDPDNVFLWRMNARCMEAEVVRDGIIALAGKLDPSIGGPEIDEAKGEEVLRRSIYFRHARDLQMEMLKVSDAASPIECFERSEESFRLHSVRLREGRLRAYPRPSSAAARWLRGNVDTLAPLV